MEYSVTKYAGLASPDDVRDMGALRIVDIDLPTKEEFLSFRNYNFVKKIYGISELVASPDKVWGYDKAFWLKDFEGTHKHYREFDGVTVFEEEDHYYVVKPEENKDTPEKEVVLSNARESSRQLIKPLLRIKDMEKTDLRIGSVFSFGGAYWAIISKGIALCCDIFGSDCHHNYIKRDLDEWLIEELRKAPYKKLDIMSIEGTVKIRFKENFANNWSKGDVVPIRVVDEENILVDDVAEIDAAILVPLIEVVNDYVPTTHHAPTVDKDSAKTGPKWEPAKYDGFLNENGKGFFRFDKDYFNHFNFYKEGSVVPVYAMPNGEWAVEGSKPSVFRSEYELFKYGSLVPLNEKEVVEEKESDDFDL